MKAQEIPKIIPFSPVDYNAVNQNWSITEGCDGNIYVANSGGVLVYNGMKWTLIKLPQNRGSRSVFLGKDCKVYASGYETFGRVEENYIPIADTILINTDQEYWNIFGDTSKLFFQSFSEVYEYDYEKLVKVESPGNIMFGKTVDGQFLLPKIESGIYEITNAGGNSVISEVLSENELPEGSKVVGMCEGGIFATQNSGLFRKSVKGFIPIKSELNNLLQKEQINSLIKTMNGYFVIGTILNGVYISEDLMSIKYHINKSNGLSNNTILSLFEDTHGNLWCGLDKGIDLIKLNTDLTYLYDKNGQLGSVFTSIIHNNTLYLGTNQGVYIQNKDGSFQIIDGSQGQVWSLLEIDGDLICGHNRGTYLITRNSFEQISDITGGWCMKAISDNVFLESSYTGLVLFKKVKGEWTSGTRIRNGDILIENFEIVNNTLFGYHPHYGIQRIMLEDNLTEVLESVVIDSITVSDPVFIRTEEGVAVSDDGRKYFINENGVKSEEFPEEAIFKNDDLAIYKYVKAVNEVLSEEQISNIRYNKPQGVRDYFIVGSNDGYIKIPYDYNTSAKDKIELDYLMVNDSMLDVNDHQALKFDPSENDVSFQFRSNFLDPQNILMTYNLEGWDETWYNLPKNGYVKFNNLQDGSYTLRLSNGNEVAKFEIKPHWYESWPGLILYFVLGGLVVYFFNRRQQLHLIKQREKLQKEKEKELESERIKAKNAELENDVIYKNKMLANSTMTLVQKNKMLIDLKATLAKEMKSTSADKRRQVLHLIEKSINSDDDWELFESTFAEVHEDFLEKLKQQHPSITNGELRLAAYIRMDLSSKEIAPLMNISVRSIENKRYRLRKKLGVEDSLKGYLQEI
ncbi:helix-turn-helix and ligand-binding sensor domain-containing protein [Portibacter lacus]|uniref:HTH luxR-type domain-containing protein n=1 Tax=Portibacter lacus TaxID=1099794 RepID=A0AA37STS5_9BACT|nr:hypothetical protein [Portibacter lacus]GLR18078.1 hypothetical protein GCM10007940_26930 [Portibacter lacus]